MPTVQNQGQKPQTVQQGQHTKEQIAHQQREAIARDDLDYAYAGDQNENNPLNKGGTHQKAHKTKKSKTRTPEH